MLPRFLRNCLFITAALSVLTQNIALAGLKEPRDIRLAVIIEATPPITDDPEANLSFGLAVALDSYIDYHLTRSGIDFRLYQSDSAHMETSLREIISEAGFSSVVSLKVSGRFSSERVPLLDKRRRRYFVTVRDQLSLQIKFEVFESDKEGWRRRASGKVNSSPRRPWLIQETGSESRSVDSLIAVTPEPVEFIIMRAVKKLFDKSRMKEFKSGSPASSEELAGPATKKLPATIVYDALSTAENEGWMESSGALVTYVNSTLRKRFNVEMSPVNYEVEWLGHGGVEPLSDIFERFKTILAGRTDSLVIGLYGERQGVDFFRMRDFDAVGFAVRGKGRAIVKLFPSTRKEMEYWRPFLVGRSLIHEFGHMFGAIHTSDLNSTMNHSATWLAPGRFDPLNREIIRAGLDGEIALADPVAYARFLSSALVRLKYFLADFPPEIDRLLHSSGVNKKRIRQAVGEGFLILAGEGHAAFRQGNHSEAAEKFREAVSLAPQQASLYYYLSLTSSSGESKAAMRKAASLGYALARQYFRTRDPDD